MSEASKAWYLENKERHKAYMKAWRLENKEKKAAWDSQYQKANPDKMYAANKKYLLKLNLVNKKISGRTLSAWSTQVRERDAACLYCGSTDKLQSHHILSKSKHPEFALSLDNGITLCKICHIQEHILNGEI